MSDNPKYIEKYGCTKMLIAAPLEYNEVMGKIPPNKIITADLLRNHLAKKANAKVTCPLTASIFMNICANAAAERQDHNFPWWHTVKAKGELNGKFPEGIGKQKLKLESEGHEIIQKGRNILSKILLIKSRIWNNNLKSRILFPPLTLLTSNPDFAQNIVPLPLIYSFT